MNFNKRQWSIDLENKFHIVYNKPTQGIYALKDIESDEILYIGSSINLHKRCNDYYSNGKTDSASDSVKWARQNKGKWYFDILLIRNNISIKELRQLEKEIQLNYKPILCKCYGNDTPSGEANARYGKHHTEETKIKISNANKGKEVIITEEAKQKISIALGKKVLCIDTNTIYNSTREAERITGINSPHICLCCNGKRKTAGGYHWKYVNI